MKPPSLKITLHTYEADVFIKKLERLYRYERALLWLTIGRHSLLAFLGGLLGAVAGVLIGGSL